MNRAVQKYIASERLIPSAGKVLLALSGGADSVALLRVLLSLGYPCEAAHCNFHLRGEESDRDEAFVRQLCADLQVPLQVIDFDTIKHASASGISIEMAARELRYNWFEELRIKVKADVIAVAHHRDDSVETVLLNLIRGTGIDGLTGIRSQNGAVVRPLLCVGREEILNYLALIEQDYVTDRTNLEDEYTRNKIRLKIMPMMQRINPSVIQSIAVTASRLGEVATVYAHAIRQAEKRVRNEKGVCISLLLEEPSPKALLFEILYPLGFNSAQVDSVFESLSRQSGRRFYSTKWGVLKDRDYLIIHPREQENAETLSVIELPASGEVLWGTPVQRITIKCQSLFSDFVIPKKKEFACLDASKLIFPLTLRKWRHGDRFVPLGMKGFKNVSNYLTDRKLSVYAKENIWVVCSANDIVWIVGERSDNRFKITELTDNVLLLELRN